jgi:tetratricopeptide (TPR) repeat protein
MKSPELDETRPTSIEPGEQFDHKAGNSPDNMTAPLEQESDEGATQPMTLSPSDERMELSSHDSSQVPTEAPLTEEHSLSDTQLSQISDEDITIPPDIPDLPARKRRGSRLWILWALLGVLLLALIAGGSVYAGYNSAIDQRTRYESTLVAGEASNQYVLVQQDIALGNYDRARQRLEYIITINPDYPNIAEQLAFVLMQQQITASPTFVPTPTLTPTPDYRSRDELFGQAQNLLIARDWTGAIDTLLRLRKNYPDFMVVKVDGMLFVALRNRGIDKIAQLYDLEGGNYDLTLAERFGPLDAEASNWRDWAELYIRGASYWGVDWGQSVYYFAQLAAAAPNLSDLSGWTASNRYLDALLGYGDWLAAKGQWCDAQTQYDTYMTLLASSQVEPTAVYVADQCSQGASPEVTPGGEVTATPEAPIPTEAATPTEGAIPTEAPPPSTTPYP